MKVNYRLILFLSILFLGYMFALSERNKELNNIMNKNEVSSEFN